MAIAITIATQTAYTKIPQKTKLATGIQSTQAIMGHI
jgi:hypothetical protein